MQSNDKELMRQWVMRWRRAGIELELQRRSEIQNADTRQAIENLDDAFESALLHRSPSIHSGFELQQALFHRRRP